MSWHSREEPDYCKACKRKSVSYEICKACEESHNEMGEDFMLMQSDIMWDISRLIDEKYCGDCIYISEPSMCKMCIATDIMKVLGEI